MIPYMQQASLPTILAAIGAISATLTLNRLLRFTWLYIRPSSVHRYIQPDSYALITGATAGIGKSLGDVLLSKGSNVIIHGRDPAKLEAVRSELQSKYFDRKVLTVEASALDPAAAVPTIEKFIRDQKLCVTMLINNLGGASMFGISSYNHHTELSPELVDQMITLNATFPTQLTRALIPLLGRSPARPEQQQRPSLILNLGSYAGVTGIPFISAYAGAKACLHSLSRALTWEMQMLQQPIEVLCVMVSAVVTQGNGADPVSLGTPTSDDFAAATIRRVGCGRRVVMGYFWHAVQVGLVERMPESWQANFIKTEMQMRYDRDRKGK